MKRNRCNSIEIKNSFHDNILNSYPNNNANYSNNKNSAKKDNKFKFEIYLRSHNNSNTNNNNNNLNKNFIENNKTKSEINFDNYFILDSVENIKNSHNSSNKFNRKFDFQDNIKETPGFQTPHNKSLLNNNIFTTSKKVSFENSSNKDHHIDSNKPIASKQIYFLSENSSNANASQNLKTQNTHNKSDFNEKLNNLRNRINCNFDNDNLEQPHQTNHKLDYHASSKLKSSCSCGHENTIDTDLINKICKNCINKPSKILVTSSKVQNRPTSHFSQGLESVKEAFALESKQFNNRNSICDGFSLSATNSPNKSLRQQQYTIENKIFEPEYINKQPKVRVFFFILFKIKLKPFKLSLLYIHIYFLNSAKL